MPRYAPLPAVDLDPRTEAQLVNEAAKRVYDSSNAKLNDFSAGNPLMALLEGQAFAQGEFLFWANQLPESVLIEWIGPFLGAMRRLGTPATTRLTVAIQPQSFQSVIPAGTIFSTNANLTGGESFEFVTTEDLVFGANESLGQVPASSVLVGSFNNVPPNTITLTTSLDVLVESVKNEIAAVGGSDVESLDQTKERFFTLIRRRNPVSAQDWQDLFQDLFGAGTFTAVLPNRSSQYTYVWLNDYIRANGHVSFFFLNPDGTEPTSEQIQRAQNVVDFSMPLEMQGHVYPIELSQVQYEIDLSYDSTADYAGFLKNFSLGLRDDLFGILTPGSVFPSGYDPTVADVNSALIQTFPENTRYSEPDILNSRAYNTPLAVNPTTVVSTKLLDFKTQENTFSVNDLLTIGDPSSPQTEAAWPVVEAFTPYSSEKTSQVLYENLTIQKILRWQPGTYQQGQVFRNPTVENSVYVVLKNFEFTDSTKSPQPFVLEGVISAAKDFQPWQEGATYYANNETTGFYDPDVIAMDQELNPDPNGLCQKRFFEPVGVDNLYYRVGWYCFVANSDFVLGKSTNTTPGAQDAGFVSNLQVSLPLLKSGGTYEAQTWLKTPTIGSGINEEVDPYYFYVDRSRGVITKYAYVTKTFTFLPSEGQTLADSFNGLVASGVLKIVNTADATLPQPLFQYSPRFEPQTLLSYKASAQSRTEYYFSLTGFTPVSTNPLDLISQGVISRIDTTDDIRIELERQLLPNPSTSIAQLCPPSSMFVFSPGDTTLFRQQGTVIAYVATQHFTPLFTPGVYIAAGVLVPTQGSNFAAIPFFTGTNDRQHEDIVLSENGKNLYRVTRFFTATSPAFNWDGEEVTDTARIEELSGNLLRIVTRYDCEQQIKAPNGPDTSGIKLGAAQITLRAKDALGARNVFVWENTDYSNEVPALSYATGGKEVFQPVSYGSGTLAL
jgi:hypothetical protein